MTVLETLVEKEREIPDPSKELPSNETSGVQGFVSRKTCAPTSKIEREV
jgi:hypothetical protein